ncbi:hypothetical protein M3Y97_00610500 [Aphelenchoides bicaudatus]|nr:hypothetical protein M3Y97_00610500 [Aphelenchoides bicaudatus]
MLSSRLVCSLRPTCIPRVLQICCSSTANEKEPQVYHRPQSMTKEQYDQKFKEERSKRGASDVSGIKVTKVKRFFLVLTGLYKKQSDVPEYITGNMQVRLGDRQRIVFIVTFIVLFFILFWTGEMGVIRAIDNTRAAALNKPKEN